MPVSKKQLLRLVRIVMELKKNSYPNCKYFIKMFGDLDYNPNINTSINCTDRTIKRDIEILKKDFEAPIDFDFRENGYYLTDKEWKFSCPILDEDHISSSLLGAQIAENIVPQPLKGIIRNAISTQLTTNSSKLLRNAFMRSLMVISGIKAAVDPKVFEVVFDGWRQHEAIYFNYSSPYGKKSRIYFEPHILAFDKGVWYTKGLKLPEEEEHVYAIQRIFCAELSGKTFKIDKAIVEKVQEEGLFDHPKLENIKLLCDSSIGLYLSEHAEMEEFQITAQEDGKLLVELIPTIEEDVIKWILSEAGNIRVLEPESLREKITKSGQKIAEVNL